MEEGLWAFLLGKGLVIAGFAAFFVAVSLIARAILRRLPDGRLKEFLSADEAAVERAREQARANIAEWKRQQASEHVRALPGSGAGADVGGQRALDQDTVAGRKPGE